jgi:pimeloyl-ACP methyl ester carboxylesterase
MNALLTVMAALLSVLALYLPARTQAFTRVTVDGQSIRMLVTGHGAATVVFENGLGGPLEHWGKVQPGVSRFARTVSYDRAGAGLSDKGPLPRDGRRIANELRRALPAANIAPPYILAGASLGGPYIRVFAATYPDDVAGLVLVDPTPDSEQFDRPAGVPELEAWPATLDQLRAGRLPAVPVFLIDALSVPYVPFTTEAYRASRLRNRADLEAESVEYQEWLRRIPGGQLIVTARSGHNVFLEEPELVVATIREAVDAVTRAAPARTSSDRFR